MKRKGIRNIGSGIIEIVVIEIEETIEETVVEEKIITNQREHNNMLLNPLPNLINNNNSNNPMSKNLPKKI